MDSGRKVNREIKTMSLKVFHGSCSSPRDSLNVLYPADIALKVKVSVCVHEWGCTPKPMCKGNRTTLGVGLYTLPCLR